MGLKIWRVTIKYRMRTIVTMEAICKIKVLDDRPIEPFVTV